jgi:hypothetical protein
MYRHQNTAPNLNINAANKSFENVLKFGFLNDTNTSTLNWKTKCEKKLSSKIVYCRSCQNIFYSHLSLSEDL